MKSRIAVLALAFSTVAAPGWGALAAEACPPCCPAIADRPCEADGAPCSLAAAPCCGEAAPAAPAAPATRSIDSPALAAPDPAPASWAAPAGRPGLRGNAADTRQLASPFRLSVVLLI